MLRLIWELPGQSGALLEAPGLSFFPLGGSLGFDGPHLGYLFSHLVHFRSVFGLPGHPRPLKTMLAPTRERDLAKIMISLLSCFWVRFLALWRVSQGDFGRHLASLRALLGGLGRLLGALGAFLGCYLAHVGALGRSVGAHELSWGTIEALGGRSWAALELFLGALGCTCGALGAL